MEAKFTSIYRSTVYYNIGDDWQITIKGGDVPCCCQGIRYYVRTRKGDPTAPFIEIDNHSPEIPTEVKAAAEAARGDAMERISKNH